jgi:hypothetical protein
MYCSDKWPSVVLGPNHTFMACLAWSWILKRSSSLPNWADAALPTTLVLALTCSRSTCLLLALTGPQYDVMMWLWRQCCRHGLCLWLLHGAEQSLHTAAYLIGCSVHIREQADGKLFLHFEDF